MARSVFAHDALRTEAMIDAIARSAHCYLSLVAHPNDDDDYSMRNDTRAIEQLTSSVNDTCSPACSPQQRAAVLAYIAVADAAAN